MPRTAFLVLYLLFMLPTYVLAWFGSDSLLAQLLYAQLIGTQAVDAPAGLKLTLLHGLSLLVLLVLAVLRGRTNGKAGVGKLALAAAIFDLAPVLSLIPLVPSALHVLVLLYGGLDRGEPLFPPEAP